MNALSSFVLASDGSSLFKPFACSSTEGRLLARWDESLLSLEWDLLLRYFVAARLLDRMLEGAPLPVRVLEVGCNIHNLFPRLLNSGLVQINRCDVQPMACDPDFFLIPSHPPWP